MHNMSHSTMPYSWMEMIFCFVFTASTLFYLFRLLSPKIVKATTGYYDIENEIWHMLCLLGMTNCFAPLSWQLPSFTFSSIFIIGTIWYVLRAYTWGLTLPHNKQWYDIAHAGMLLGMWWMYAQPFSGILAILLNTAFWIWFTSYYVYATLRDSKNFKALTFGQDIAHLLMAIVMLGMTLVPQFFMPSHAANSNLASNANLPQIANCCSVNENNFKQEVTNSKLPVLAIVYGGCEQCQIELQIFKAIAPEYAGKIKFVTINEEQAPKCKEVLGVKQCPTMLVVKDGQTSPLKSIQNQDELKAQLDKFLSQ